MVEHINEVQTARILFHSFSEIWKGCINSNVLKMIKLERNGTESSLMATKIRIKARGITLMRNTKRRCDEKVVVTPSIHHSKTGMLNSAMTHLALKTRCGELYGSLVGAGLRSSR